MLKKQAAQHAAYLAELAAARQRPRCPRCFIVEPGPRSTFRCVLDACPRIFAPLTPIEIRSARTQNDQPTQAASKRRRLENVPSQMLYKRFCEPRAGSRTKARRACMTAAKAA